MKQFHADECSGSFVLPFGATIGVDQEGISVFKDGSTTRCFFHGLKVFAAKTVQSRIVVTVKGIIQQVSLFFYVTARSYFRTLSR